MKHLLVLGTIAALALSTTAEAKGHKEKKAARQMVTRQQVYNTGTTRFAPARTSTVVQRYSNGGGSYGGGSNGGRYYGGSSYGSGYYGGSSYGSGYYGGGYPYYGSGSSISIGIGSGYYGSGYGYGGYPYYNSGYGGYPYGYNSYGSSYSRGYGYNVVVEVQQRLARAGYYHGVIDGVAGRGTRGAIARWESSHGMYADGRIDRQLLRSLGLG
jgi:Putative peptidoglycan binding domain